MQFQSTRPRGARPVPARTSSSSNGFQSTRPRGARPTDFGGQPPMETVSIHAPAWGATGNSSCNLWSRKVSIHAPAWGATLPCGGYGAGCPVSIHAPAWGATRKRPWMPLWMRRFNPRARVGRDDIFLSTELAFTCFNPRARVGRDDSPVCSRLRHQVSIHAPAWGATNQADQNYWWWNVSIHAPAWGATCMPSDSAEEESVSIHAPAWGAT